MGTASDAASVALRKAAVQAWIQNHRETRRQSTPPPDARVAPAKAAGPAKAAEAADKVQSKSVGKMQVASADNSGANSTGSLITKLQKAIGAAPSGTDSADMTARKAEAQAWIEDWRARSGA